MRAKILYVTFVLIGIFQISVSSEYMLGVGSIGYMLGVGSIGIALIFDPFDHKTKLADRPFWQRSWMYIHIGMVFVLFGYAALFA